MSVRERPLENQRSHLLRLEFEIFKPDGARRLKSTGAIACRDIALGSLAETEVDPGVQRYATAMCVQRWMRLDSWLELHIRRPWVEITFGPTDKRDHRNPFVSIVPFDGSAFDAIEFPYELQAEWVKVGQAAVQLKRSESTIRRLVDERELEYGGELVRRSSGNQRWINLDLLRNLIPHGR